MPQTSRFFRAAIRAAVFAALSFVAAAVFGSAGPAAHASLPAVAALPAAVALPAAAAFPATAPFPAARVGPAAGHPISPPSVSFPAAQAEQALAQDLVWRNIGPANPGGRIVDIEAVEGDFKRVFVATASGGVWKSVNAGNSWEPIFDDYAVSSIGDIAIFQADPEIIWVGTGEANNRNSVSWGNGVYRSTDGGAHFEHLGLDDTHQIARVVTHPSDPDVAYVAAIGHLWGHTGDRGLFKTTDGGATWTKLGTDLPIVLAAAGARKRRRTECRGHAGP